MHSDFLNALYYFWFDIYIKVAENGGFPTWRPFFWDHHNACRKWRLFCTEDLFSFFFEITSSVKPLLLQIFSCLQKKLFWLRYRQPGRLWTVLNHFYLSLPLGLSKKSAYRLNVTLMVSATRTVITKKTFRSHKAYILSQKVFKVAPVSGVTLNAYQHALKPSLTSAKLPSHELCLT